MKVKPESPKEKDVKLQTRSQPKASPRKPSNSLTPSTKEKSSCSPEPAEGQGVALCSEEATISEGSHLPSSCSPAHKLFQRTLSPADVLHVHSYAKGDYGEVEALLKEERRSENSDTEKDNRPVSPTACLFLDDFCLFSLLGSNVRVMPL